MGAGDLQEFARRPSWLGAVAAIFVKDLRQYYGKAPVISWGLLFPITLVILLGYYGAGMGSWRIIPGLLAIALLFSASSMAQVVVSFDKMSGGIELLVHAPVPGSAIVVAKSLGGIVMGLLGSSVAAATLYLLTGSLPLVHPGFLVAGLVLGSVTFTFMGTGLAIMLEPVQAVAALNFLRFTMIFFGGLLPATAIPSLLKPIVYALPMAYIADLIRYGTFNTYEFVDPVTALAAATLYFLAVTIVSSKITLDSLMP